MKTRIISGAVAIALLVGVLIANSFWSPTAVIFLALLSAVAAYEMLYKTGAVELTFTTLVAMVYSFLVQFAYSGILPVAPAWLTVCYVVFIVYLAINYHEKMKPEAIALSLSMPIIISFAFSSLATLLNTPTYGIFYLVLLLNFSSVADCFAYFTGVAIGKHKLAPVISPKKTVEGAIGGILGAVLGTVVICLIFGKVIENAEIKMLPLVIITPIMVIIGIMGDLFASAIKRHYGIKDYGNIMPGHGGVLDRFDSILILAPVLVYVLEILEVIL